jgi:tetratricopeptide (TPR) repeat protein
MLLNVGRTAEAVEQLHRANDMLALYVYTPLYLAQALVVAGKPDEAKTYFDAAIDLAPNAGFVSYLVMEKAVATRDINLLLDPALSMPEELRAALLKGYRALASHDSAASAQALETLLALPEDQQREAVARLVADFGANHEAFKIAARIATTREHPGPSLFWDRSMRGILDDPGFPEVATQLGLMKYWKTTQTRPDVCDEKSPPAFCGMI